MMIETACQDYAPWLATAPQTGLITTSYTSGQVAATLTEPVASATRAIIDLDGPGRAAGGPTSKNILDCMPYIKGANNAVITAMRVWGWRKCAAAPTTAAQLEQWVPKFLFELGLVAGNLAGPANGIFNASWFQPDTVTLINPAAAPSWLELNSPVGVTADLPGGFRFDTQGFRKLELEADLGANATAFNILVAGY